MTAYERLLPQNVDAERGVLGSILIDPACFADVRMALEASDFYLPAHRDIYATIEALWATRTPADLITLPDALERRGLLEGVGGASYVSSLANQVPTSASAIYYAGIVFRTAQARRLIHAAGQVAGAAYNDPQSEELARDAQALLTSALARHQGQRDGSVTLLEAAQVFMDEHLAVLQNGGAPLGVRYGLEALDKVLLGIKPSELVYLCGRPGAGKSALATYVAHKAAEVCAAEDDDCGTGTVEYLTFEMRASEVVARMVAALASIDTHAMRANFRLPDGSIDDLAWAAACEAAVTLQSRIGERIRLTTCRQRLSDIRLRLEQAVTQRDCRLAVIDYLGLIAPEDDRDARQDNNKRVSDLSRELKQIAQTLDIPILCLVQMSRASERRADPRPILSDLRDSGGLEQDGNAVIGLVRLAEYLPTLARANTRFGQFAEAHILKARQGSQSGIVVPLRFEGKYTRFSDWPREWPYHEYLRLMPSDDGQTQSGAGGESEWSE